MDITKTIHLNKGVIADIWPQGGGSVHLFKDGELAEPLAWFPWESAEQLALQILRYFDFNSLKVALWAMESLTESVGRKEVLDIESGYINLETAGDFTYDLSGHENAPPFRGWFRPTREDGSPCEDEWAIDTDRLDQQWRRALKTLRFLVGPAESKLPSHLPKRDEALEENERLKSLLRHLAFGNENKMHGNDIHGYWLNCQVCGGILSTRSTLYSPGDIGHFEDCPVSELFDDYRGAKLGEMETWSATE